MPVRESVTRCAVRGPAGSSPSIRHQRQGTCVAGSGLADETGPVYIPRQVPRDEDHSPLRIGSMDLRGEECSIVTIRTN